MLLYGIVAVAVLWVLINLFAQANMAALMKALRIICGILALGAALLLGLRGRVEVALALGALGAWLLGWSGLKIPGTGGYTQRTSGSVSRVRSVMVEMELDHDTGEMDGTVLAGALAGRPLSSLDVAGLQHLLMECHRTDPDGVRLLEAYLDRRFPNWRETAQNQEEHQPGAQPRTGAMTDEEAYQILGLSPGASHDEIRQAHRTLMKKLHPDQGGTTYLAAQINRAKEILLGRHP